MRRWWDDSKRKEWDTTASWPALRLVSKENSTISNNCSFWHTMPPTLRRPPLRNWKDFNSVEPRCRKCVENIFHRKRKRSIRKHQSLRVCPRERGAPTQQNQILSLGQATSTMKIIRGRSWMTMSKPLESWRKWLELLMLMKLYRNSRHKASPPARSKNYRAPILAASKNWKLLVKNSKEN